MCKLLLCPQPTPHVSLSPSLLATMDGASTLTGVVIMVSACSLFFSLYLQCACSHWEHLTSPGHSLLCMFCHQPHIGIHSSFCHLMRLCVFTFLSCLLLFCVVSFVVSCYAVRPLCCLPLVLSFRKGLWGRL